MCAARGALFGLPIRRRAAGRMLLVPEVVAWLPRSCCQRLPVLRPGALGRAAGWRRDGPFLDAGEFSSTSSM
jgi:hypothetical protein